ncbi:uncharacterized protein B0H18DRAFT_81191 [Fomitopsis serialis]|uniref:uncharacterized protein n=1 Tax=Fomitopsis serialis TaxID=139415 RepID=UPI002007DC0D|nr:uncharacterized protein B0H18DRAFT_81191 [Neoantrodia serialis]KAH9915861.1 hypothetical protein B0H18DRAFT_81191 [Neoantrodia serialis]
MFVDAPESLVAPICSKLDVVILRSGSSLDCLEPATDNVTMYRRPASGARRTDALQVPALRHSSLSAVAVCLYVGLHCRGERRCLHPANGVAEQWHGVVQAAISANDNVTTYRRPASRVQGSSKRGRTMMGRTDVSCLRHSARSPVVGGLHLANIAMYSRPARRPSRETRPPRPAVLDAVKASRDHRASCRRVLHARATVLCRLGGCRSCCGRERRASGHPQGRASREDGVPVRQVVVVAANGDVTIHRRPASEVGRRRGVRVLRRAPCPLSAYSPLARRLDCACSKVSAGRRWSCAVRGVDALLGLRERAERSCGDVEKGVSCSTGRRPLRAGRFDRGTRVTAPTGGD